MRTLLLVACATLALSSTAYAAPTYCAFSRYFHEEADHQVELMMDKRCSVKSDAFRLARRELLREHPDFEIVSMPGAYDRHNSAGYYLVILKRRRLQIPDQDEPTHVCSNGLSYKVYPSGKRVLERTLEGACTVRER